MGETSDIEIIRPDALRPDDRAAWDALRASEPGLDHPYLDPRYALAAAKIPGAADGDIHPPTRSTPPRRRATVTGSRPSPAAAMTP